MTDPGFRDRVRLAAAAIAFRSYQRQHPRATSDQAHCFAERSWRRYVPAALDFLAICQADAEARRAAALN